MYVKRGRSLGVEHELVRTVWVRQGSGQRGRPVLCEAEADQAPVTVACGGRVEGGRADRRPIRRERNDVDARQRYHGSHMREPGYALDKTRVVGTGTGPRVQDSRDSGQLRGIGTGEVDRVRRLCSPCRCDRSHREAAG